MPLDLTAAVTASQRGTRLTVEGPEDGQSVVLYYRPVEGNTGYRAARAAAVAEAKDEARAAAIARLPAEELAEVKGNPLSVPGMRAWTRAMALPVDVEEEIERGLAADHLLTGWEGDGGELGAAGEYVAATSAPAKAATLVAIDWIWLGLMAAALRGGSAESHRLSAVVAEEVEKNSPAAGSSGASSGAADTTSSSGGNGTPTKSRASARKRRNASTSPPAPEPSPTSSGGAESVAT